MHGNVVLLREEERLGLAEWLGDTNKPKLLPPGLAARPPKAVVHGLPVGPRHHAQKVDVLADRAREEEGGGEVLQPSGLRAEDAPLALPQLQAQLVGSLQGGRGTDSGGEKKKMGKALQDAFSSPGYLELCVTLRELPSFMIRNAAPLQMERGKECWVMMETEHDGLEKGVGVIELSNPPRVLWTWFCHRP